MKRSKVLLSWGLMQQYNLETEDEETRIKRTDYRNLVWTITEAQPLQMLEHIDQRSFLGYHLDHIVSIADGFKHGFPPEWIGDITNLRMLPAVTNIEKGRKSDPTALSEMIARLTFG